ncbi:MAG: hypothetical protein KAT34_11305 [Candidatus Aminicenantes bacterium]|nr:hypothetical protein [Candidatus Aminicenantes bacterium]
MKKRVITSIVLFFLITAGSMVLSKQEARVTYFSLKSLYFYTMGSFGRYNPTDEHFLELGTRSANAFSSLFGGGFRLVNIRDRFFFNLEADYSEFTFDFGDYARDQKIGTLTVMVDLEWFLRRLPVSFTFGVGATLHFLSDLGYYDKHDRYISTGDDTVIATAMRIGIKYPLSRRFTLRSEFRWSGEYYGDYYNNYYWDSYGNYYDDSEWDFIFSALCFGVEYHF